MIIPHAEVMFMLAVAQTVNPGMLCMFGGMPCTTRPDGDLAYSHDAMNFEVDIFGETVSAAVAADVLYDPQGNALKN
jgi:hypothetical protein